MTDNEIIKAYVNCIGVHQATDCQECPYHHEEDGCYEKMTDDILSLINRQKAEIAKLQGIVHRLKRYDEERDIRLHARLTEKARAEAIKEFADRLKDIFDRNAADYVYYVIVDDVAKEMVGDTDG